MGSTVYLKLKNGRLVSMLDNAERGAAETMKRHLDRWVEDGQTLSITHANGSVEELTPTGVQLIEITESLPKRSDLDLV